MVCTEKESFWRCKLCTVAAHTICAPGPVIELKDDRAICWRHPSDWLVQNKVHLFPLKILSLHVFIKKYFIVPNC
jgi:hypothetical protein